MKKKYCIFDMDGTLVDSMGFWRDLGKDYLCSKGITGPKAMEALKKIKPLTMLEAAKLFQDSFDLPGQPRDIVNEMSAVMEEHYRLDVPLKEGVAEYLERRRWEGCRMCVATATDETLAWICLKRLGIDHCFEFLLSCETLGVHKTRPDIYLQAAERFGSTPEETAVFEDAMYAARTAKDAGFYTVAIWDAVQRGDWGEILSFVDEAITDWRQEE